MAIKTGDILGLKLCELLGIPGDDICAIEIKCMPGKLALVTIEEIITEEQGEKLKRIISEYELIRKEVNNG